MKILVVDDASTVRMYHRGILEDAGFEVDEAVNGVEALEKALESTFDLYVVDINMPKMDGYQFLNQLRAESIDQAPALMVSTEAEPSDLAKAYAAGANAYLVKPIRPAHLMHILQLLAEED